MHGPLNVKIEMGLEETGFENGLESSGTRWRLTRCS